MTNRDLRAIETIVRYFERDEGHDQKCDSRITVVKTTDSSKVERHDVKGFRCD
jgi:hypothetical protein